MVSEDEVVLTSGDASGGSSDTSLKGSSESSDEEFEHGRTLVAT